MPMMTSRGDQHLDVGTQQFQAAVAEDPFGLRIDEKDLAFLIDNDHRVGSGFQERSKLLLAFSQ